MHWRHFSTDLFSDISKICNVIWKQKWQDEGKLPSWHVWVHVSFLKLEAWCCADGMPPVVITLVQCCFIYVLYRSGRLQSKSEILTPQSRKLNKTKREVCSFKRLSNRNVIFVCRLFCTMALTKMCFFVQQCYKKKKTSSKRQSGDTEVNGKFICQSPSGTCR